MKKLIFISLCALLVIFNGFAGFSLKAQEATPQNTDRQFRQSKLSSTLDGIEIPQDLLEYIQYYFEGHAVTKAEKIRRSGQELYRLRVDRDDLLNDYSSFLLVFDLEWKFLQFEKQAPPPAPKPKPAKEKEKPKEQERRNNDQREDEESRENGPSEESAVEEPTTEVPADSGAGSGETVEPAA
jgi:hypothetical protein